MAEVSKPLGGLFSVPDLGDTCLSVEGWFITHGCSESNASGVNTHRILCRAPTHGAWATLKHGSSTCKHSGCCKSTVVSDLCPNRADSGVSQIQHTGQSTYDTRRADDVALTKPSTRAQGVSPLIAT